MKLATLLLIVLAASCSRPSSSSGQQPVVPAVALFVVSGHNDAFDGNPSTSYLQLEARPEIVTALQSYGLTTWVGYYVDDAFSVGGYGGFLSLVQTMQWVRDHWSRFGTRVVVVAHSHGGVWANAAIGSVPDLDVACQVNGHEFVRMGHRRTRCGDGCISGDPRDASIFRISPTSCRIRPTRQFIRPRRCRLLECRLLTRSSSGNSFDGIDGAARSGTAALRRLPNYFSATDHQKFEWRRSVSTHGSSIGSSMALPLCLSSAAKDCSRR
jgi:hypothetical protein